MPKYRDFMKQSVWFMQNIKREEDNLSYSRKIEVDSEQLSSYYNFALKQHNNGDFGGAINNFNKVAELNPKDASVFNNLGVLYYSKELLEEAKASFRKAIELEPNYPEGLYGLGNVYLKQERIYDAIVVFQKCLNIEHPVKRAEEKLEECYKKRNSEGVHQKYKNILIVMDEGIGNMVMLTPAIKALKMQMPGSKITILGTQPSVQVLDGWDIIEKVLTEPDDEQYDIGFLSVWSRKFIHRYGVSLKAQCDTIYKIELDNIDMHEAEHHLKIARFFGYEGDIPEPFCMAKDVNITVSTGKKIVALSNTTLDNAVWEKKRWPYYHVLARELNNRNYTVLLIGGKEEAERFSKVDWPAEVVNCHGKYDIQETAGLLKKCDVFIGNDSGPAHIAAASGVPTYVLFGPTLISKNQPRGSRVNVITKNIPCSPCQYTKRWDECKDWQCMSQITVEDVLQVIGKEFSQQQERQVSMRIPVENYQDTKKILIVGVLDVASSTNVFMKKGFEKLGWLVDGYNYRTRMQELGSPQAMWDDFRRFLNGKRYELIVFCKVNGLHPDLITYAGQHGKTWYWFMDHLGVAREIHADEYVKRADFASATSEEVCNWFRELNPKTFHLIEGFDPETYFHEDIPKIYDLLFVGNATEKRINELRLLRNGQALTIFGDGWPQDLGAKPPIYNKELRKVICQSKIVLNLVHADIFSDRVILTAASGGFVLSQSCPDLERYFQRKHHMDWFQTAAEAQQLIHYYLGHDAERKNIAQRGMNYVRQKYSWESVCKDILQKFDEHSTKEIAIPQEKAGERVLFVSWHGLGDNVMLTPALKKYKQLNPSCYIGVAGLERFGEILVQLLSGLSFVDEVIPCLPDAWNDFPDYKTGVAAVVQRAQAIGKEKGFSKVVVLPTNRQEGYKLHKVFRFADEVGVEFNSMDELQTELYVKPEKDIVVKEFFRLFRRPILILHTNAGNQLKTPSSEFIESIISDYKDYTIFEFGRKSTRRSIEIGENDMELTKAIVKNADRVIAIDSVVMHIAGAFKKPCLAIFTHTPIHQAIPLTYPVDYITNKSEVVQEENYKKAREEIEQIYGLQKIPASPQLKHYINIQESFEKDIHKEVSDYGHHALKFLQLIIQRLPEPGVLPSYPRKSRVLEIGCNSGYNTKMLAQKYGDAIGIDINSKLVTSARACNWSKCYQMDMHYLAFKNERFDFIFAKDVLEHAYDPDKALRECFRVLLSGGLLVAFIPMDGKGSCSIGLTTGNLSHYWKTNPTDCEERIEQAGFSNVLFYRHSYKEIVGYERPMGDEILVVVAEKPYVNGNKGRDFYNDFEGTGIEFKGVACEHIKNKTIISKQQEKIGQKKSFSHIFGKPLKLPKKYYDPDAYWAAFLTLKCTSNCVYCIQRIDRDNFKKAMNGFSMLSGDQWISFLNGLYHPEGRPLAIIGGEPTIHPDFVKILNGLEGYMVTVTTNLKSRFYKDLKRSIESLKPKCPIRFNTSFHPNLISAEEFCNRILQMKGAGLWVDQIAMVDHPCSQFENYRSVFTQYGIRLTPQSLLGKWDGRLYPDPNEFTVKNDPREHGITDMVRYREGFSAQTRRPMLCSTKRFLIAPDGVVYNCHYRLYSRSNSHCGKLADSSVKLPEDFFQCEDYGFCNPCDYPHVIYKQPEQSERLDKFCGNSYEHRNTTAGIVSPKVTATASGMNKCPFCGNYLEGPIVLDMMRCKNCGIYRKYQIPTKENIREHLKGMMLSACHDKGKETSRMQEAKYQLDLLQKYLQPGRLFDVGAAGGFFMKAASDRGWQVVGNEISMTAIQWARQRYGLEIMYGFLEELKHPQRFYDAVVLWHSLEHTIDPRETLAICRNMLVDGGVLMIGVPEKKGEDLVKRYEPLHFYEFNRDNLHWFLQELGFEPLEIIIRDGGEDPQINLLYRKKTAFM